MSPIEYIEEGIRQGNWETVCEGYERLTGEYISPPEIENADNDSRDALEQVYRIICSTIEPGKKISLKKSRKKKTKKATKNTITEDGEDLSLRLDEGKRTVVQRELGETHLITNEPDPVEIERNRERAEKSLRDGTTVTREAKRTFKAKCSECEQKFDSDRPSGEMGQKCGTCLKNTKRPKRF